MKIMKDSLAGATAMYKKLVDVQIPALLLLEDKVQFLIELKRVV